MSTTEEPAGLADEQPKRKIAKKVVSANRRYFVPKHSKSILAESATAAVSRLEGLRKKKVGDGQ